MICNLCQREVNEGSAFCAYCGTPLNSEAEVKTEKECLDNFYRFFKYERLAWKILGIIWGCICGLFGFLSLLFFISSAATMMFSWVGVLMLFYTAFFLPIAIVNLKMVSKAEYYMDTLYNDASSMRERAESVGMIILATFFNEIALIFIIINFVRAKTCKETLDRIELRQKAFRGQQI